MSTPLKIIIGLLIGSVVLCTVAAVGMVLFARAAGTVIEQAFVTDLAQVADISSEIAVYTLPEGFGQPFAAQAAGSSIVGYTGNDGRSHIYFFQLPAGVHIDPSELEKQARQAAPSNVKVNNIHVVERRPGVIAGQEVTLIISEGLNHSDEPFREVSAIFEGKSGQALVTFSRPTAAWDDAEVEAFLASIQ
jgi:hypothetical protein